MCIHLSLKSYCSLLRYRKNKEHKNAGTVYHASPLLLSSFYLLLYFPYFKISFSILLRRRAQDYNLTIVMRMGYVCAISHFHYNLCGKSNVTEFLMSYILHEHFFFPASFGYISMDDAVAEHCNFDLFMACITITLVISSTSPKWKILDIQLAATEASHLWIPYIPRKLFSSKSCGWVQDTDITKAVCFSEWYYGTCSLQNLSRIGQFVA